jgi:23S rRNA (uracil1939-C5)-methyltransferase
MNRKSNKTLVIFEKVEILDTASEGKAIARVNDMVIFVENAVPGDIVDIQITRKKSKYREAKPIKFHQLSDKRTDALCSHFGTCGGCKWQHMKYEEQLFYKQKQVIESLKRIGKIELPEINPIIPSAKTSYYRNKLEFTFSDARWLTVEEIKSGAEFDRNALGFHIPGMFDKIVDIDHCYLQPNPSNSIRLEVKKFASANGYTFFNPRSQQGLLRNLLIRTTSTGELMILVVFHEDNQQLISPMMMHLSEKFPDVTSLLYVVNPKRNDTIFDLEIKSVKGPEYIVEEMEGLKFRINAKSFYQTNSEQAYQLYKVTREFAQIQASDIVYDLYTGTGTIANFVARQAAKVVGIEYVDAAIEDAKINSQLNLIQNTVFYAGDMKDMFTDDFIAANGKPRIIITDPPRAGMHQDVVNKLLKLEAERIVYVSCNPSTQARDLLLMDEKYKVLKVQPVDMFPHTHHVENVVLLELKS